MRYSIYILLVLIFSSCDTYEEAHIVNNSSQKIEFTTIGSPATITEHAVLTQQMDDKFFYELAANSPSTIIQLVNKEVEPSTIPFHSLIIINQLDTLSLNSREEIFDEMTRVKGDFQYDIEVE